MPPQMAATLPPDVPTIGEDTFEERRDAIDLVATLRARALRVALFGTLIHRPPLDPGDTSETTDDRLAALEEQVDAMVKVRAMMAGDGNYDRFAPSLCVWLVDQAQAEPDATMNISKMISLSQEILALAQTEPGFLGQIKVGDMHGAEPPIPE